MDNTNVAEPAVKDEDKVTEAKATKPKTTKSTSNKKVEKPAEVTEPAKEEAKKEVVETPTPAKSVKDEKPSDSTPAEAKTAETAEKSKEAKVEPAEVTNESKSADKPEVTEEAREEVVYPFSLNLTKPVTTYRGASIELMGKPFGGKITVLGCTSNGFYQVSFVRSSVGITKCYMLRQEVERCRS